MKLYNVYWHDGTKLHDVVTTDDVNKWLEENNKERIANGEESESLSDFEIHEVQAMIYSHAIVELLKEK
tara:strand:- start:43 stop:249 length:207 start_codon:yes stop_codon:yes gene_type:complete